MQLTYENITLRDYVLSDVEDDLILEKDFSCHEIDFTE